MGEMYHIKVSTETLRATSTDVLAKIAKTKEAFDRVTSLVGGTKIFWESQGQKEAVYHHEIRKDDYERVFREFSNHVEQLQEIAGVYEATEKMNEAVAFELPGDLIV